MPFSTSFKTKSLKTSLFLSTFLVLILTFGLIVIWAYQDTVHEVNELFDAQLASQNHLMQNLIESQQFNVHQDTLAFTQKETLPLHEYESKLFYQLINESGNVRLSSFDQNIREAIPIKIGFQNAQLDGNQWRLLIDQVNTHDTLIVGQQLNIRNELIEDISMNLILHFIIALPILAGLFTLLLNRHLNQLNRLSTSLSGIQPHQRHLLKAQSVPAEIAPLVIEIDQLLERAEKTLEAEREFISSAAHELKTPFSAMRLQLENLRYQLQTLTDNSHYIPYLNQLFETLDRSEYLTSQLLTLQKMQPNYLFGQQQTVDLHQLTHQVVESLAQQLIEKSQTLDYKAANLSFNGYPLALQIILSNLVSNAIRYTPEKGIIQIRWTQLSGNLILSIEDSGPGIPKALRARVFERFYRQNEHRHFSQGCGLGLNIVQKAVQNLHGSITLSTSAHLKGLRVEIQLPFPKNRQLT